MISPSLAYDNISATSNGAVALIQNNGVLLVDGTTNLDSNKTIAHGGAFFLNNKASVSLTGPITLNANEATAASSYGGAIVARSDSSFTFGSNATLTNNKAGSMGGAIESTGSSFIFAGTTEFSGNQAGSNGGGIWSRADTVTKAPSSFIFQGDLAMTNNTANQYGGAIYSTLTSFDFHGATKISNNAATLKDGGAIYSASSIFTFYKEADFDTNSAQRGGAILAGESGTDGGSTMIFKDKATFTNNTATQYGGAISTRGGSSSVFENDATFKTNRATQFGGAIDIREASVTILGNALFDQNAAGYHGGAIFASTASMDFNGNVTMTNNTTSQGGGAIYAIGANNSFTFQKNLLIKGNTAVQSGGAISSGGANNTFDFYGDTAINDNHTTTQFGGAIYSVGAGSKFDFHDNATISENTANTNGGGIYMLNGKLMFRKDLAMDSNVATQNGGAIYLLGSSTADFQENVSLSNNEATAGDGGAIYSVVTPLLFQHNLEANDNKTGQNGGAIYGSAVTIGGIASLRNNEATANGGGFYGVDFNAHSGGSFINNRAGQSGGAIYAGQNIEISALGEDLIFTGNTATSGKGGAIYLGGALLASNFTLNAIDKDVVFSGNQDTDGANAIYFDNVMPTTATFNINEGQSITFFDPIQNSGTNSLLQVNKKGGGLLSFDGSQQSSSLDRWSQIYGITQVEDGIFEVANQAVYGSLAQDIGKSNPSRFSISDSATLQGGIMGTVRADQIEMNGVLNIAGRQPEIRGIFALNSQEISFGKNNRIRFNTEVIDKGSSTDFLFVQGNRADNNQLYVEVKDLAPDQASLTGRKAGDGIFLIQTVGTGWTVNDAKLAQGPIAKKGFVYDLYGFEEANKSNPLGSTYSSSYNWYLQSIASDYPLIFGDNNAITLQMGMMTLQNLHQRLGESQHWNIKNEDGSYLWKEGWQPWGQYIYQDGTTTFSSSHKFDYEIKGFQVGIERMMRTHNDKVRQQYGFFIGQLDADNSFQTNPSNETISGNQRATYGGLYWTYQQADEQRHSTYFDASVMGGQTDHSANYFNLADKYDGKTYAFSLEAGRSFRMGEKKNWIIEPQIQLYYGRLETDGFFAEDNSNIGDSHADTLIGRLGFRVQKTFESKDRRVSPYFRANLLKPLTGSNVVMIDDTKNRIENQDSIWQIGIGITGDLSRKWSIYSEINRQWGGILGWELRGGLKVKF